MSFYICIVFLKKIIPKPNNLLIDDAAREHLFQQPIYLFPQKLASLANRFAQSSSALSVAQLIAPAS
jgi:hypothetical protein